MRFLKTPCTPYAVTSRSYLKKHQSASRPSEHPPVMGEKMSKRLGGIKGCKYKTSTWYLNRFPDADNIGSTVSRALSLRNLVSGYECGKVFPAGVGPGSPSRDAVNWLPSRFSLSVETRRRYGWLRMMVFPGARLFRAPIWCPSGGWRHARGREHCRGEPGSSLPGGYAPDSAKAEGSSIVDEPGEG